MSSSTRILKGNIDKIRIEMPRLGNEEEFTPMQRFRKFTIPALLIAALLAAGCSAASPGSTPAATLPAVETLPAAAPTQAVGSTATAEPVNTLPAEQEVPATGAEATPTVETPAQGSGGVRFEIVPEKSEARYRVREQLANLTLPNDAIGKTNRVSGAIVIGADGQVDPQQSRFEVDVSTLQSDQSRRDNFLKRSTLQTDQYPIVSFVPKTISGLSWPLPESGNFSFQMTGDMTIRDVTREVTWDVTGTLDGGQAVGQAVTKFTFADFNLEQPRVPVVLSIVDEINLELDATMQLIRSETGAQVPGGAVQHSGAGTPAVEVPVTGTAAQPIVCNAPAPFTPAMTEGPYYSANPPERTSLIEPGMTGQKLVLTGYVLDADCTPVPGALVDFWQADAEGNYDNSGYRLRGKQFTDAGGRYTLETVVPGLYPGRTAHIHVKVQAPGGPLLTSQLFFPGEAQNQTDRIFDPALLVEMQPAADGFTGTFNFVVNRQ